MVKNQHMHLNLKTKYLSDKKSWTSGEHHVNLCTALWTWICQAQVIDMGTVHISNQYRKRKKQKETCIPCAHFIEHVEDIVHGSVNARNREHDKVLVNCRWLDEVQTCLQWKKKSYWCWFEGDGREKCIFSHDVTSPNASSSKIYTGHRKKIDSTMCAHVHVLHSHLTNKNGMHPSEKASKDPLFTYLGCGPAEEETPILVGMSRRQVEEWNTSRGCAIVACRVCAAEAGVLKPIHALLHSCRSPLAAPPLLVA